MALSHPSPSSPGWPHFASHLVLSDRLLALAEDADRAGCTITAQQLLALAHTVFDEPTRQ